MKNRTPQPNDWRTPPEFYNKRNKLHEFGQDPCPWMHDLNEWDGLVIPWDYHVFVNPPYSLKEKTEFVKKGISEMKKGKYIEFLLPVSLSTALWHDTIKPNMTYWFEHRGRLRFIGVNKKGQKVNYDLINEWSNETIVHNGKTLPLYIKGAGQMDTMTVVFDGRDKKKWYKIL